jgi:predicted HAD superfamily Cof-like phosphohydrolase
MKTDFQKVQEFNKAAEQECPDNPSSMSQEEVFFLTKMILDEIMEFMVTVSPDYKKEMVKMIEQSDDLEYTAPKGDELIAEQGDALVDMYYYSLNASAKHAIDLSSIFSVVHEANMAKKDPKTGKFLRRKDGKIIKPDGWKSPNITEVITRLRQKYIENKTQTKIDDFWK